LFLVVCSGMYLHSSPLHCRASFPDRHSFPTRRSSDLTWCEAVKKATGQQVIYCFVAFFNDTILIQTTHSVFPPSDEYKYKSHRIHRSGRLPRQIAFHIQLSSAVGHHVQLKSHPIPFYRKRWIRYELVLLSLHTF